MNYLTVDEMLELLSKGRSIWKEETEYEPVVEYSLVVATTGSLDLWRGHILHNNAIYIPDRVKSSYKTVSELRAALTTLGDCVAEKPVLDLFPIPKWYEAIPPQGVLCWVGDVETDIERKIFLARIVVVQKVRTSISTPYQEHLGKWWRLAVPLTNEEIQSFLTD